MSGQSVNLTQLIQLPHSFLVYFLVMFWGERNAPEDSLKKKIVFSSGLIFFSLVAKL